MSRHHDICSDMVMGWPAENHGAESAVKEIDCDVSFLEDAPREELEGQSDMIGHIAERLKGLNEKLHKE